MALELMPFGSLYSLLYAHPETKQRRGAMHDRLQQVWVLPDAE